MLLPATQYLLIHSFTNKLINSMTRYQPPLKPKLRRDLALKNKDSFLLNGGYVPYYDEVPANKTKFIPMENWRWYTESKESPGSVRQTGGGIGKLDAANEDGFFFKLNKSRLKKLKELLKEKRELKSKEADKKPDN